MKRVSNKMWTTMENTLLKEYYYTMSEATLKQILPGRSLNEMQKQVAHLTRKNHTFKR
jgi:hypothetical protein